MRLWAVALGLALAWASSACRAELRGTQWKDVGLVQPSLDLAPGDRVGLRVFDHVGERQGLMPDLVIPGAKEGKREQWPALVAAHIAAHLPEVHGQPAEVRGEDVVPLAVPLGSYHLRVRAASAIQRIEIEFKPLPVTWQTSMSVVGLRMQPAREQRPAAIQLGVIVVGTLDVNVQIIDAAGRVRGASARRLEHGGDTFTLPLAPGLDPMATVVVRGSRSGSGQNFQYAYPLSKFPTDADGVVDAKPVLPR